MVSGEKGIGKFTLINHFLVSIFDKDSYDFKEKSFKCSTRGDTDLSEIDKSKTDAKEKTDKGDKKSAGKKNPKIGPLIAAFKLCLLYTSPSPRD